MGKCKLHGYWIATSQGKEIIMAEKNDEVISVLNDLIETCKDGEQGFRTAAEGVGKAGDAELRTLFNAHAQQRARFAADLQNEVLHIGGDPSKSGHVSGSFHRGWMNLKAAISANSEASIIEECESGERSAVKNYEDALKKMLPLDLKETIENQYAEIKLAHSRLKGLERAYKAS
jgi:uncharacterized protein (TIGR02284 family)